MEDRKHLRHTQSTENKNNYQKSYLQQILFKKKSADEIRKFPDKQKLNLLLVNHLQRNTKVSFWS